MNKKGFTLIELLVVVLIIGILSSVALPQYQKTVLKSRAAEAWSTLGAIRSAGSAYCLENPSGSGWYSSLKDSFAIEIKNSKYFSYGGKINCSASPYQVDITAYYLPAGSGGGSVKYFELGIDRYGRRVCGGPGCKDIGARMTSATGCMEGVCGADSVCYNMD